MVTLALRAWEPWGRQGSPAPTHTPWLWSGPRVRVPTKTWPNQTDDLSPLGRETHGANWCLGPAHLTKGGRPVPRDLPPCSSHFLQDPRGTQHPVAGPQYPGPHCLNTSRTQGFPGGSGRSAGTARGLPSVQEVAPALGPAPCPAPHPEEGAGVIPAQSWDLGHPNLMDRSGLTLLQPSVAMPGGGEGVLVTRPLCWNGDP